MNKTISSVVSMLRTVVWIVKGGFDIDGQDGGEVGN